MGVSHRTSPDLVGEVKPFDVVLHVLSEGHPVVTPLALAPQPLSQHTGFHGASGGVLDFVSFLVRTRFRRHQLSGRPGVPIAG